MSEKAYRIVYSCGHEESVYLSPPDTDEERQTVANWMKSQPCRECSVGSPFPKPPTVTFYP